MDAHMLVHPLQVVINPRYQLVAGHQNLGTIVRAQITSIKKSTNAK